MTEVPSVCAAALRKALLEDLPMPQKNNSEFATEDAELASFLIAVGAGRYRGVTLRR